MSSLNDDEDGGEIQIFSSHIAPDDADVPSASATALEIEHRSLTHCLAFPHSVRRPVGRLNIAAQLNQQRLTGQHCDCTLIVRFQPHPRSLDAARVLVLPAHKAVLAAASDYFDVMFKQSLPNDSEFTIYFELRDEVDAFPSLLDFMYSGCTVFAEEHAIGLMLLADRMRLPRLLCGALRYLNMFLRMDNVLPVWRALHQIGALHAARTGSALQLSIHVRPKTARQLRREHLQRARLARIELRRDARIQKLAEREEAERFKREAHGLSEANERAAIQAQIEQFRAVVSQERRRTQLDEARKRQAAADERQRKAEEEAWRRQMHETKTSAAVAGMGPPPMSARSAAAAAAVTAATGVEVPPTPRTPTGASSQSRALLVAQALAIAKEKERARELEKAKKGETQSSAKSRLLAKARASAERVADDVRGVEQRMNSHFSEASLRSLEQSSQTGLSAAAVAVATSAAQPVAELSEDALRRHAAASGTASAADAAPVDADQLSNASSLSSLFSVHSETPPPPLVLARFVPLRCLLLQLDRACSSLLSNHLMDVIEVLHAIESDARRENRRRLKALERAERKLSGAFAADEDADTDDSSVDGDDDEEGSDPLSLSLSGFDSRPSEFGRDEAAGAHFGVLPSWLTAAQIQIILKQTHLQVENEDQVLEIIAEFALHLATSNGDTAHLFSGATNNAKISAAPSGKPLMQQPRKDAASATPHLVVITAMKALILRPQLTLGAASILLRPRYQPIAAHFLDILQPSSATIGSPMSRNSSRASLGASKAGHVGSAPSAMLKSPTAFSGLLASPSSAAVSAAAQSHVPSLLLATAQAAAAEAASLEAAVRPVAGLPSSSVVAASSCAPNGVGPAKLQRRVYVGSPQLDWGTLRLNQHVRVFGKQHPHCAAGVSALAQLSSTKFAVGFFAEPAASLSGVDGIRVANARAASTHVGAIGVPSSHDSNLALIDLKLRRPLDEADDAPPPSSMLDQGTTTTAMLPAAPHMINALTTWRNLVIGGDGAGMLHVWAQTDPRRPESWTRQSAVQLDSGLSSLQVWCDRLLCAQVDRPAQLRSLPDVAHVEQTLRVGDHDADNAGFHAETEAEAEADGAPADEHACSQTWFFPAIEVGGHPGFVTAQTALTVWMRDPHFARHKPAAAAAAATAVDAGEGGEASREPGILGLGAGADQGATLVVLNDPEMVDADDEAQQGYSAVRVRPGESRAWLTPAADQQSVRCLAVAHLSPLDAAPVFGLAVGTDQSHIYCGLEMTGEVIEVRLELYPHAHLVRTQRITVFETGCSVSRLLLLDDVLIAASSSPLVGADGADGGAHDADDADMDEYGRVGTTVAQSRLRIMRRAPTVMPDALIAGLSIGDAAAALGLDASFDSAAVSQAVSAVTSPLPVDAATAMGSCNPFDQPAWDEALIGAHTGAASHHAHGAAHHAGGQSMADTLLAAERQRLVDEDEAAQLMEAADDPDLCPLPARMRRADDEPLPPPPPHFSLDQVAPRAWHLLHHLDVRKPVFDFALLDHALVVGGVSGDVLVFSSM